VKSLLKEPKSSLEDGLCVLEGMIQSGLADQLERIPSVSVRYLL